MTCRSNHFKLVPVIAVFFLLGACLPSPPTPDLQQVENLASTAVVQTLTALPSPVPPTDTPLPTPTEVVSPTSTVPIPTVVPPTTSWTPKPDYACDIIEQRPFDDTFFRPNASFDIKWTLVNTGLLKWKDGTYLAYQNGPQMTVTTQMALPNLEPGERYNIVLDATAPVQADRQIMVWAVIGPGLVKNSVEWLCYPYVRIIVK